MTVNQPRSYNSYNANAMNARSFADRYRKLSQLARMDAPDPKILDEDWPLPEGFQVEQSALGVFAVREDHIFGPEVDDARALIEATNPLPVETQVFLDTETTGLAGGTGTYSFLIGVGRFTDSTFTVKQLFMRHPGEEPGLLLGLERELSEVERLITFNGRSFDVPLLVTRYRMHHREFLQPPDHLDLLPSARAIWKHRLDSCALSSLEQHILGVERELDVPGWEIPALYANYLRDKDPTPLAAVSAHNIMDIFSLARLSAMVAGYETGQLSPSSVIDRLAISLMNLRGRADLDAIMQVLEDCSHPTIPSVLRRRAIIDASTHGKRIGCWELLISTWNGSLADPSASIRAYAAIELAKYYEHRARDYERALSIVERAIDGALLTSDVNTARELRHRCQRLQRKVNHS